MLEKNKDYIEMCVFSTDCTFTRNTVKFSIEGYIDSPLCWHLPDPVEPYVIISKEKFEELQTENEQLKKKLHDFDPMPEYKELLKELYSTEDVEKLEWTLNHVCGGMSLVNGWWAVSSFWKRNYKILSKLVGFSSVEEIQNYLTNEAECDTLHEAITKLDDEVKYTFEKLGSANSINNSWKATAECNSPKELMAKLNLLRDNIKEWKEATGCPSPSSAKTLIESGASWHYAYNEIKKANEKLADNIKQWQEATGCETPDKARSSIADMMNSQETTIYLGYTHNVIARWQKVTGFNEPKDFLKWKTDIEGIMEAWRSATGCSTPEEAKRWSDKLGEANGNLGKAVLSWQEITGFSTPEKCSSYIDRLEKKLEDIKDLIEED